jgi:vancomycin resistance protein YoaR
MPYLDVIERYPHNKRWAFYYGSKIFGDDAAMYENSKKMIIKNTFNDPIYFKVYEQ